MRSEIPEEFHDVQITEIGSRTTEEKLQQMQQWTVFTDGSTKLKTGECGWGAVIATNMTPLHITNCIVMGGAVGVVNNYAAELMAILAVCEKASFGKKIDVFTDSKSSIESVRNFSNLTVRKQTRQPCRPILQKIQKAIYEKRLKSKFEHVKSHQPITNWKFHGNDIADRIAKIASVHNKTKALWPDFASGETFVSMKILESGEPLINDPRKEIAEILRNIRIKEWEDSSQGVDVRRNIEIFKKWKKETSGTELEDFGLIFWTRLFPTVTNIKKIASKENLWPVSCTFCQSDCVDDDQHMLRCPSTWNWWKDCFQKIEHFLTENPQEIKQPLRQQMAKVRKIHIESNEHKQMPENNMNNMENLQNSLHISSLWSEYYKDCKIKNVRVEKCTENEICLPLTKQSIRNLKNESAIILDPKFASKSITKFEKEIVHALKKKDPFRLVFIQHKSFEIPDILLKYCAVITDTADFNWIMLTNPSSLVLDPTDWYEVRKTINDFSKKYFKQEINPVDLFQPKVPFPDRNRKKLKQCDDYQETLPIVIELLPSLNPLRTISTKKEFSTVFANPSEQNDYNIMFATDLFNGTVFYDKNLEAILSGLLHPKALKFVKKETRKTTQIIIKKRFKWFGKLKKQLTNTNMEKTWNLIMGETGLNLSEYSANHKQLILPKLEKPEAVFRCKLH